MRIIANGDIEIGHQSFERCPDITILDIQLGQPDARLGRLQSAVHVPLLRQQLLLLRQLRPRVLNRGFERPGLGDRLLILVGADKAAAEERFQPAGMGARISRVRLQPRYLRAARCDRLLDAADLRLSDDEARPARAAAQPRTAAGRSQIVSRSPRPADCRRH